jgi:hypothetical protein
MRPEQPVPPNNDGTNPDNLLFLDNLPDPVLASMEVRDRWFASAAVSADGKAFFLLDLQRWLVGSTVRVAFLGGDTALHRDIEAATRQITDACNVTLDFGFDKATGQFRTWSTSDTEYRADIRVAFDQSGFSSLIGRDAITSFIGTPDGAFGGRPHQRSLNLGGFPIQRPANWMGVVRHEFLHAVAFLHEHQHPSGGCEFQFRWEDDPGYAPTLDADGRYITDSAGRRPGIYSSLAGFPNYWTRPKVDHNLRPREAAGAILGDFDQSSVMLYRFPALFYRENPNPCAPTGNGIDLSDGDLEGLLEAYPFDEGEAKRLSGRRNSVVESLSGVKDLPAELRAGVKNLMVSP